MSMPREFACGRLRGTGGYRAELAQLLTSAREWIIRRPPTL